MVGMQSPVRVRNRDSFLREVALDAPSKPPEVPGMSNALQLVL